MNHSRTIVLACAVLTVSALTLPASAQTNAPRRSDYPASAIPMTNVQITDSFWTPRLENNRTVSVPAQLDHYGDRPDLRLLEAACYLLELHPDPALRARVDGALDRAIAQIRTRKNVWSTEGDGDGLWAGNFLELGVAYYEATGSRKVLDVAIEIADNLDSVFGPDKRHDISNHEGLEIGLLRLYRCTGDERYQKLAKFFIDARGNPAGRPGLYGPYAQDQEPVVNQTRAIGHAVRAMYLYMPLTDIAALYTDPRYSRADERIWTDAVSKRTFLTGGVGSYRAEENFGDDYDLPNLACWNEICAAYGNTLWNEKLFLLSRESKYVDMMERVLYNALLVGVSLKGDTYLYQAPLKAYGDFARHDWYGPNCCPPNLARLLPQLGSLIYARTDQALYVNLFVGSKADINFKTNTVKVTQETEYPWDGAVKLQIDPQVPQKFSLLVRLPGWSRNVPFPGNLYHYSYIPPKEKEITILVNGAKSVYAQEKGYARIDREWKAGDVVQFTLPMIVRRVTAADWAADDRGMLALERGPLVFCAEQADNPGGVFNLLVPDNAALDFTFNKDLLGGIGVVKGKGLALARAKDHIAVDRKPVDITAIPYYAFGNRARGEMSVWLAHDEGRARIGPKLTIASQSKVSSSVGNGTVEENYPGHNPPTTARRMYPRSQDGSGSLSAVNDQLEPVNSEDGSAPFLRLHPQEGDSAWVQYDFSTPQKVSSVEVYWKDDKQFCVLPASWRVVYLDGTEWKPVQAAAGAYTVTKDTFNKVDFQPVTTSAMRLEIQLRGKTYKKGQLGPPDANYMTGDFTWYEGGVIEWKVNP